MRRNLKHPLLIALAVTFVVYFSWRGFMSSQGYCHDQGRYLSDKEYILIAMAHNRTSMLLGSATSPEEYLSQHPDCCAVSRHPSVFGSLFTYKEVEVELNYEPIRSIAQAGVPYYTKFVQLSACGKRGAMYGMGTRTLRSAGKPFMTGE